MNMHMETMPEIAVIYMRRTGPYGGDNRDLMERLKAWAAKNDLLESGAIWGVAWDDPAQTPPEHCRYDVCLVSDGHIPEPEAGMSLGQLPGGQGPAESVGAWLGDVDYRMGVGLLLAVFVSLGSLAVGDALALKITYNVIGSIDSPVSSVETGWPSTVIPSSDKRMAAAPSYVGCAVSCVSAFFRRPPGTPPVPKLVPARSSASYDHVLFSYWAQDNRVF